MVSELMKLVLDTCFCVGGSSLGNGIKTVPIVVEYAILDLISKLVKLINNS